MDKENIFSMISEMSEEELKDLARNTSDVEALNILAENENYKVRKEVAGNKNTPVEKLAVLAQDKHWWVRQTIAENRNTSSDILATLAKDESWFIRNIVAKHENTPTDILVMLSKDEYPSVCTAANKALKERRMKSQQKQER